MVTSSSLGKRATSAGSAALASHARYLATQARQPVVHYEHTDIGYNYRLTNIAAGLGLAQLERLPGFLEAKHRIARRYDEAFVDLPLTLPPRIEGTVVNDKKALR